MIPVLEESRDYYITPLKPEKNNEILNRSLTLRIKKSMPGGVTLELVLGKNLDWIGKKKKEQKKLFDIWHEYACQKSKPNKYLRCLQLIGFNSGSQVSHSFRREELTGD